MKVSNVRDKGCISKMEVSSLTSFFAVPKGKDLDVCEQFPDFLCMLSSVHIVELIKFFLPWKPRKHGPGV